MSHPEGRDPEDENEITSSCFMCPDCFEWTSGPDPCCGVGPMNPDIELEDK